MKRLLIIGLSILLSFTLVGCATGPSSAPAVAEDAFPEIILPGPAKLVPAGVIELKGKNFEPGAAVNLTLSIFGQDSIDIGSPKADSKGNWTMEWAYGQLVEQELLKPMPHSLIAWDQQSEMLAEVYVKFTK